MQMPDSAAFDGYQDERAHLLLEKSWLGLPSSPAFNQIIFAFLNYIKLSTFELRKFITNKCIILLIIFVFRFHSAVFLVFCSHFPRALAALKYFTIFRRRASNRLSSVLRESARLGIKAPLDEVRWRYQLAFWYSRVPFSNPDRFCHQIEQFQAC